MDGQCMASINTSISKLLTTHTGHGIINAAPSSVTLIPAFAQDRSQSVAQHEASGPGNHLEKHQMVKTQSERDLASVTSERNLASATSDKIVASVTSDKNLENNFASVTSEKNLENNFASVTSEKNFSCVSPSVGSGPSANVSISKEEEAETKAEEALQQLVEKLKDAMSVQVQASNPSHSTQDMLCAAEHVSRTFFDLINQAVLPAFK
ncbi:hypothetical protein NDU88_003477 [Pleurodeles waltl]|uniref:Uncharacterized protein n=2 Tax=Pleurodeles waltl TaxID=8319 RepID=A0AAV7UDT7_PLEWA|nr:hypothetical protein NDU88_003477 [Pleurodeles waltl]